MSDDPTHHRPLTRVRVWTTDELLDRRRVILDRHGMSLDEFRERAATYALAGREHDAWDELRDIAYLLGG